MALFKMRQLYKKIILFGLLFTPTLVEAQVLRVGPKVGIQASRTVYNEPEMVDIYRSYPSLAYHAGGVMNVKVSDMFSFQTELLYQITKKHVENREIGDWQKESYQFLSLPLLLRASMPWGRNEIYVNAGPSISYWLAGRGEVFHGEVLEFDMEVLPYDIAFSGEEDTYRFIVEEANRFQLGLDLGIGTVLPMGRNFLMVDLRYTFGHTNMARETESYIPLPFFRHDLLHTQQVLSLSAAYLFNFDIYSMRTKGKSSGKKKE